MARRVDLNADVGEGYGRWSLGDDVGLMPIITSANVACGLHAGDPSTIRRTCAAAAAHGVVVGAQVAYPDLMGFGRRFIDIDRSELTDAVVYQIGALEALARAEGAVVAYVKPHGALYNTVVHHHDQAAAVVDAIVAHGSRLPLLGLPGSVVAQYAEHSSIAFVSEGFADRGYTAEGTLVPRDRPGALLTDASAVAAQALALIDAGVESICVHSDTPGAAALAAAVRHALTTGDVELVAFVR